MKVCTTFIADIDELITLKAGMYLVQAATNNDNVEIIYTSLFSY